jgi:predicted permease
MAFVLIAGASLMIDGFIRLGQVHPGFDPSGLLTFSLSIPSASYQTPVARKALWQRLDEKLASIPGVESVALMSGLPPLRRANENDTQIEGWVRSPGAPQQSVVYDQAVSPRFFQTLGIRLVDERFLENRDLNAAFPGVMINQAMAHTFWPNQSPLGRRIRPGFQDPWYTIVGIVADAKNHGVDRPTDTEIFTPYQATPFGEFGLGSFSVALKTQGDPKRFANLARDVVASLDPSLPMADIRTMDEVMQLTNARPRFYTLVLTMFSTLALTLAGIGVYGMMSYAVTRRTIEFGIRMALGAEPAKLFGGVMSQGLLLTAAGAGAGAVGAFFLTRLLQGLVFGVQTFDLRSFVLTLAVLILATLLATSAPAARVIRIEPVQALREE